MVLSISNIDSGIALNGRLTVETVTGIYNQAPDFKLKHLDVDLSGIEELDSSGLALLVYWKQEAKRNNCGLRLINPPEQVTAMARISDLEGLLEQA